MRGKKRAFKYALDPRPLRVTPEADAVAAQTFGDVVYAAGKPTRKHFKYGLEKRPVRFSPNAAEAAAKAFGDGNYTVGNPPEPPEEN